LSSAIGTPILGDPALTQKSEHPPRFAVWKFDFAAGKNDLPSGSSISLSAKTICRPEVRFRRRRKRFAAWKFDFAVGENDLPPGSLISLSAKTICRLEV
jgi:hypothetical protein